MLRVPLKVCFVLQDVGFDSLRRSDSAPVPTSSPSDRSLYDGVFTPLSDRSSAAIEDIPRAVENNGKSSVQNPTL